MRVWAPGKFRRVQGRCTNNARSPGGIPAPCQPSRTKAARARSDLRHRRVMPLDMSLIDLHAPRLRSCTPRRRGSALLQTASGPISCSMTVMGRPEWRTWHPAATLGVQIRTIDSKVTSGPPHQPVRTSRPWQNRTRTGHRTGPGTGYVHRIPTPALLPLYDVSALAARGRARTMPTGSAGIAFNTVHTRRVEKKGF